MKKIAQPPAPLAGISNIYMKRKELQKTINDSLTQFKQILDATQKQITEQATQQLNNIVQKLNIDVERKLNEIQRLIPQPAAPAAAADDKHSSVRDNKYNKNLPDFWRRNYDYNESPYMNIEKLDKITDKIHSKKKRKV